MLRSDAMLTPIDHLEVTEILRPTESGMTQPFQCRLEDDQLYAVKGRGALPKGLLSELYAAQIGISFGLPIPDVAIAWMPTDLLESYFDASAKSAIGSGAVFASSWQAPVDNISVQVLRQINDYYLSKVYVFDHWIANGDRTLTEDGGNVNMLVRLRDNSLIVIDHNLAFNGNYSAKELELHACRPAWMRIKEKIAFKRHLAKTMVSILADIKLISSAMPDEWVECEPGFADFVKERLEAVHSGAFWDELDG